MQSSFDTLALDAEARGLTLHAIRTLAVFAPLPIFGQGVSARFSKLGLGMVVAYLAYVPRRAVFVDPGSDALALVGAAGGEILYGLLMGFSVKLALQVLRIAGDLVSQEMGLNLAFQFNPASGESTPLIGYLYESVGTVLFFALGVHHALLRALFASFDALPVGRTPEFERLLPAMLGFGSGMLEAAFRMAAPAFFALLLIGIVLAFLSKVAPQWHLIDAGYPLRAAVGLVLIGASAPVLLPLVDGLFARVREDLARLVVPS